LQFVSGLRMSDYCAICCVALYSVPSQDQTPISSELSHGDQSSGNSVSLDNNRQVRDTSDECAVYIESDVFRDRSAARSSRCRVQSDAECVDSIFDYHCLDPSVDLDDIRVDGEDECVLSCSEDCLQAVVHSDSLPLDANRLYSEDVFTPALSRTLTVNEVVSNRDEAATNGQSGHSELPLGQRAEPSSTSSCEQHESRYLCSAVL